MNALYAKYHLLGLEILAFPSGQFYNQEPGTDEEILNCLKYVRPGGGFVPMFPLFKKADVNGQNEQPIYTFLKSSCGDPGNIMSDRTLISWNPVKSSDLTWNFTKFLITKDGKPYKRYEPEVLAVALEPDIEFLLAA